MSAALLLLAASVGALFGILIHRFFFAAGLFTGGKVHIPKHFTVVEVLPDEIPEDARAPVTYLGLRLKALGFSAGESPVRVPVLERFGHKVILVPFVHSEESCVFLMGIDARWTPRTELMLHLITPLSDGRRVETTTLGALRHLRGPERSDVKVVTDAASVDEIWSHHRRALMAYERKDRAPLDPKSWKELAAATYAAWLEAGIKAQRLRLDDNGVTYRPRRAF